MSDKVKAFFKKESNIILALLFLSFIVRFAMFLKTGFQTGLAAKNIITALEIIRSPELILYLIKGKIFPLYHIVLSFFILIFKNPILVSKILNLILGTVTIIPFYLFIKTVFDKKIALWSSLVFIFYLLHVKYSTLALPNILLIFLILYSLYFFFINKKSHDKKFLILSSVFIGLACMLDYVSWIIFLFCVVLLLIEKRGKDVLIYLWFPLIMILIFVLIGRYGPTDNGKDIIQEGSSFYDEDIQGLDKIELQDKIEWQHYLMNRGKGFANLGSISNILERFVQWFRVIAVSFNPPLIILGLLGIVYLLIKKEHSDYIVLFFVILIFIILGGMFDFSKGENLLSKFTLSYTTLPMSTLPISTLIIPLSILGIIFITKRLNKLRTAFLILLVFITFLVFLNYYVRLDEEKNNEVMETIEWIKDKGLTKESTKILISNVNNSMWTIILYGDIDLDKYKEVDFIPRRSSFSSEKEFMEKTPQFSNENYKLTLEYLRNNQPNYLIYAETKKSEEYFNTFNLSTDCNKQESYGIYFECVYKNNAYTIYKLSY